MHISLFYAIFSLFLFKKVDKIQIIQKMYFFKVFENHAVYSFCEDLIITLKTQLQVSFFNYPYFHLFFLR